MREPCGRRRILWQRAPRRGFPYDATANRFDEKLPERLTGGSEDFDRLVDMIGKKEPGDWIDLYAGIDFVDARGNGALRPHRGGADQSQPASRGRVQAWRSLLRRGTALDRQSRRHHRRVGVEVERSAKRIDDAGAEQSDAPGGDETRRRHRRGAGDGPARVAHPHRGIGQPEERRPYAIERRAQQIERARGGGE